MRIGLALPARIDLKSIPSLAKQAEAAGFDLLASGEHVFFHQAVPNAFVALAGAAGATQRIRLLSAVTLLTTYPAPLAAKMAATLDGVSNGRFEFGIGVGGEYPAELRACGVDPATRGAYVNEALDIITKLFAGDVVHHRGRFCSLDGERLNPPPVQRPGPPIWVGGRRTQSIARAARFADVWMPHLMEPSQVAASLDTVRSAAVEAGRSREAVTGAYIAWTNVNRDEANARRVGTEVLSGMYNQDMSPVADRYLILGSPERVVERILEYRSAGAENVILALATGEEGVQSCLEVIAADVLPSLARI